MGNFTWEEKSRICALNLPTLEYLYILVPRMRVRFCFKSCAVHTSLLRTTLGCLVHVSNSVVSLYLSSQCSALNLSTNAGAEAEHEMKTGGGNAPINGIATGRVHATSTIDNTIGNNKRKRAEKAPYWNEHARTLLFTRIFRSHDVSCGMTRAR